MKDLEVLVDQPVSELSDEELQHFRAFTRTTEIMNESDAIVVSICRSGDKVFNGR